MVACRVLYSEDIETYLLSSTIQLLINKSSKNDFRRNFQESNTAFRGAGEKVMVKLEYKPIKSNSKFK